MRYKYDLTWVSFLNSDLKTRFSLQLIGTNKTENAIFTPTLPSRQIKLNL